MTNFQQKKSLNELKSILKSLENRVGKDYFDWVVDYWTSRSEPLDFKKHKYLEQIYLDQSPEIIFEKSGQAGITERMITEAIWLADQFVENALYLFPTSGTISDLVQERVDDPINNNQYLEKVSGRAKKLMGKQADKVGMKRLSKGFVYFRGSNKPTQITSVSADAVFVDELDRMDQTNVPYFNKRLIHSKRKWMRWASTPTIPNFGIDLKFQESDQHYCHIKCEKCNEWQILNFEDNIDCEKELLICKKCKEQIIPWQCEMKWKAEKPKNEIRGYHVSQLYSPMLVVKDIVKESRKTNEYEIQQFFNQDLGLPYEPRGSKITEDDLDACKRDFTIPLKEKEAFIGIDVGKVNHYIIIGRKKLLKIGTVKHFEELDELMKDYNIKSGVIDALPETRKSQEFANRFRGRIFLCYYTGLKEVKKGEWFKKEPQKVNTDRTISLDFSTNVIKKQEIELPKNLDDYTEFKKQMKNLSRVIRETSDGNKVAEYLKTGEDHWRHAFSYSILAKSIFDKIPTYDAFVL